MLQAPYESRTEEGHLPSLETIFIEMKRFRELRKNKDDVYNKVIHNLVQKDGRMDFVNNQ